MVRARQDIDNAKNLVSYDSMGLQVCGYAMVIDKEIIDTITARKHLTETDVHDIRVDLKRLRAMRQLSYFESGYTHFTNADTNLRDAGRLLSANRDQTVLRKTLKKLLKGAVNKEQRKKVKAVLSHVRDTSDGKGVTDKSIQNDVKRFVLTDQRDWRRSQRDLAKTKSLVSGLARTYEHAKSLAEQIARKDKSTTSHRWRKWCKYLCYQLQFFSYLDPGNPRDAERILDLKRLGSVLGWRHDIEVLYQMLDQAVELDQEETSVVKALAKEWDIELKQESDGLSKRLFADQPLEFVEGILRTTTKN